MISRSQAELNQMLESLSLPAQIEPHSRTRVKCLIAWVQSSLDVHLHKEDEIDQLEEFSNRLNQFYMVSSNRRPVVTNPGMTGELYFINNHLKYWICDAEIYDPEGFLI